MWASFVGCSSCRRNSNVGRVQPSRIFRCSFRGRFWHESVRRTRPIRFFGKCCRWKQKHLPSKALRPIPSTIARRPSSQGLLGKYAGRVLMVTTGACAVHCRYCFRRHFPYQTTPKSLDAWQPAIEQIEADESIHEVILSGGDPLMLVDDLLAALAERLARVPHLRRLRVHTRLPIVIPERVNDELLGWLTGTRLTPIVVVHANHPAEIDDAVAAALGRLIDAGVPVLNQAVLLARRERFNRHAGRAVRAIDRFARDSILSAPVGPRGRGGSF